MTKIFALVDCNTFFASCEKVFRPDLKNRPVIVLSNNDGCIVAASKEAKALGIKMFSPYYQMKNLLAKHNAAIFSSNYTLYGDLSARVMRTLSHFAPSMEIYSIDEAFLDLSGMQEFNFTTYAQAIKHTVMKNVGIPVSVGIAHTKVLAKLANHIAKKSEKAQGAVDLTDSKYHDMALSRVLVEDIWGIGRKGALKLNAIGIKTAKEFRDYHNIKYIQQLLTKTGRQIQQELRGELCLDLEENFQNKKNFTSSKSFGCPVYELKSLQEAIACHCHTVGEKLRKQNSVCGMITIYIRTNPFKNIPQYFNQLTHRFYAYTLDTCKITKAAHQLLNHLYQQGYEYKKVGVILDDIHDKEGFQLDLFQHHDSSKDECKMKMMDFINEREGNGTLKSAACGTQNEWRMLRKMKSPSYTTKWNELPLVGKDENHLLKSKQTIS